MTWKCQTCFSTNLWYSMQSDLRLQIPLHSDLWLSMATTPNSRPGSALLVSPSANASVHNASHKSVSCNVQAGRRGFLTGLVAVGAAASIHGFHGGAAMAEEMAPPEVGLREGRLRGCDGRPPCVSTSAFQSPSRFMPPWTVSSFGSSLNSFAFFLF